MQLRDGDRLGLVDASSGSVVKTLDCDLQVYKNTSRWKQVAGFTQDNCVFVVAADKHARKVKILCWNYASGRVETILSDRVFTNTVSLLALGRSILDVSNYYLIPDSDPSAFLVRPSIISLMSGAKPLTYWCPRNGTRERFPRGVDLSANEWPVFLLDGSGFVIRSYTGQATQLLMVDWKSRKTKKIAELPDSDFNAQIGKTIGKTIGKSRRLVLLRVKFDEQVLEKDTSDIYSAIHPVLTLHDAKTGESLFTMDLPPTIRVQSLTVESNARTCAAVVWPGRGRMAEIWLINLSEAKQP